MKIRLDQLLVQRSLGFPLEKAQALIMAGLVFVAGQKMDKCGTLVDSEVPLQVTQPLCDYVSRGGEKLEGAHQVFGFLIQDRVALDVGISTGGFTDFLLQHGARFVFGVDVGYGQLAYQLRTDPRVAILERTNARYLTKEALCQSFSVSSQFTSYIDQIDLVVMDASFISITKLLPVLQTFLPLHTDYIVLVKPQFEAEKGMIEKGGIITDPQAHLHILETVKQKLSESSFRVMQVCDSPIKGPKGNKEFFFWIKRS